ncbi:MAG TPA: TonB-dependent receptor [Bacteroidales bacterium]|nr:TonB-dependent receptor [Bacteroidales bacterium]
MKLTLTLVIMGICQLYAGISYSQSSRITLNMQNAKIEEVFAAIEKQSEFEFFYNNKQIDASQLVTVNVEEMKISDLLNRLLADRKLGYKLFGNRIILVKQNSLESELIGNLESIQQLSVTGTVRDASTGDPVPGVNIVVEGTTLGMVTDTDGKYTINVPSADAVLLFSYIGYVSQKVSVNGQSALDISLAPDIQNLEEVVVVGYGVVKKRDLTGSVSSLKSTEITKVATNNAMQSMQGRVAGLDISKQSGESGSGINIDLRGNRSINASNNPLILVDGLEYGSTLDLNASDIESMEVLKDASSTAIYGTRGANGVIIITTKRGAASKDKYRVSVNSYLSFNSPTNIPKVMNAQEEYLFQTERLRYNTEKTTRNWGSTKLSDYTPETVLSDVVTAPYEKSVLQLYREGGVDWFDILMRNSVTQNYEVGVSGAGEKSSFALSLGYMNEQGLLRNDELNRYNVRLNLDHSLNKRIKIGSSMQYTYKDWDKRDDGVYNQAIKMHTLAQPYLSNGEILDKPSELAPSHTNPLLNEVDGYYQNNTRSNRFFGNVFAEWEILKGLKFRSMFGLDQQFSRNGEYEDYMCTGNYQSGRGSYIYNKNVNFSSYTWENTLNYLKTFSDNFELQGLLGQSAMKSADEYHQTSGFGLTDHYGKSGFYDLSNIITTGRAIDNSYVQKTMLSYFGRLNMKFLGKLLLTGSLRADGSSVLSEGNKWGYFPSVAGAYIISEESFLKNLQVIDNLKLRASWGKSGNAAVDPYRTLTILGLEKTYYTFLDALGGETIYGGQVPAVLGNPDLTWETTSTMDFGLDLSLFSKVNLTFDYYFSKTNDLLLYKALPATSVYPQVLTNIGKTENKGFEVALNVRWLQSKNFRWSSDFTYSMNKDKIVALSSGEDRDISDVDKALVVGQPVRAFYGYEADGTWAIADSAIARTKYNKVPGAVKLVDKGDDGVLNDDDKRLYNKSPKFIFGMNNNFDFYDFSLSVLVYAKVGQWIQYDYNTAYKPTEADGSPALDYWTPENQGAKFPRPGIESQNDLPALAFEKASYLKVKDLTLAYQLPSSLLSKMKISRVRVYGSLQNYFTFSNIDNYDPERGGEISNPLAKQMVFGLNVEF